MTGRKYDEATARALFQMTSWKEGEAWVIRDGGVFVGEEFRSHSPSDTAFDWTPAYDMDWPGSPNPISAPLLPLPFTANELAACLLEGSGLDIQEALASRIGYALDDEALNIFSRRERWVVDALRNAYALAEKALTVVGEYNYDEHDRAYALVDQWSEANGKANTREQVFKHGISHEEANDRRARAVASVADLKTKALHAKATANAKWAAWRKAMVRQLLAPIAVFDTTSKKTEAPTTQLSHPTEAQRKTRSSSRVHKTKNRSSPLDAEIAKAKETALDRNDYQSVWNALVKLANERTGCLLEAIENEIKYQSDNDIKFFKKRSLKDRMKRAMTHSDA